VEWQRQGRAASGHIETFLSIAVAGLVPATAIAMALRLEIRVRWQQARRPRSRAAFSRVEAGALRDLAAEWASIPWLGRGGKAFPEREKRLDITLHHMV
jgi:hypothetical protein